MSVNTATTLYKNLPETTDASRAKAVREAFQREMEMTCSERFGLSVASWKQELQYVTVAELLARNTDALVDDYWEAKHTMSAAELTELLTAVKVGSDMLDTDYLDQCSEPC